VKAAAVPVLGLIGCALLFFAAGRFQYPVTLAEAPELTAAHLADPRFSGTTVAITAEATGVRRYARGMLAIRLRQADEDLHLEAPVFPRLGCLPVRPLPGESVRVHGNLGNFAGRPQVRPLSAAHVRLLDGPKRADAVSVREARVRIGETLFLGPFREASAEPFTSRAGLRHFRLRLADASGSARGVLFEGNAGHCPLSRLRGEEAFFVTALVEEFEGEPSLNVRRVILARDLR